MLPEPEELFVEFRITPLTCELPTQQRLKARFLSVWLQLPGPITNLLMKFWNCKIQLVMLPEDFYEGPAAAGLAGATLDGRAIGFRLDVLNLMHDAAFDFLIAHELAHCVCRANGQPTNVGDMSDGEYADYMSEGHENNPEEIQANEIATQWGFSKKAYEVFCESNEDWLQERARLGRISLRSQAAEQETGSLPPKPLRSPQHRN